jgi:hypothetical protein
MADDRDRPDPDRRFEMAAQRFDYRIVNWHDGIVFLVTFAAYFRVRQTACRKSSAIQKGRYNLWRKK